LHNNNDGGDSMNRYVRNCPSSLWKCSELWICGKDKRSREMRKKYI